MLGSRGPNPASRLRRDDPWGRLCRHAAIAQLRAEGHEISDEDVARLSPLKFKNLNVLGRYSFTPSTPPQGLRPLRDPDAPELDEDDDGSGDEWTAPEAGSAPVPSHGGRAAPGPTVQSP
ncbi:hypothetical protein SLUN_37965 [Streptomyces lunaelactis]|uniref:Tn3 transposase DDE domain-containing protein n=1 Tax=Streptomyces lunaelactis TaxID=1535768 RepID=A0A2R4TDA1_9ACTN|nr:transposase [Streptomyces lunaelactis]AVZ77085.1 hypothetical protein SLUN_37965 [Streptomyces lunaelactis]